MDLSANIQASAEKGRRAASRPQPGLSQLPSDEAEVSALASAAAAQRDFNNAAGSNDTAKPDPLSGFKAQVQPAGFEASGTASATISAQSGHAVAVDDDPATAQPAVLQTYPPGINNNNAVEIEDRQPNSTVSRSASLSAVDNSSNSSNHSHNSDSPPAGLGLLSGGESSHLQVIVLRKHTIWVGVLVVIAVVISFTVAFILSESYGSAVQVLETVPTTSPNQVPAQDEQNFPRTNLPSATEPPSTLLPTRIPLDTNATDAPTPTTIVLLPPTMNPTSIIKTDSETKLTASGAFRFGVSVAIEGTIIVIGAPKNLASSGNAYIYTKSGTVWTEQAKLTGAAFTMFGESAAINGDTIVVGARNDFTESGDNTGSAYVYTRSGTVWTEQSKLTASDGNAGDSFGYSVAIDGKIIVIGALMDDTGSGEDSGSAYVYTHSGTVWREQTKLTASDGAENDHFGGSVAVDGDTIVVGAYDWNKADGSGSNYVYIHAGTVWTEQAKLTVSDGAHVDHFGWSVAISGDTIVIGAFLDDTGNSGDSGSAYVFTRFGTVWTEQAKLMTFGTSSTAIDGGTIVIGAYLKNVVSGTNSGSAYIFTSSGTVWTQQAKLLGIDGADGNVFGISVAIDGETIVIGAVWDDANGVDSGSVYIF